MKARITDQRKILLCITSLLLASSVIVIEELGGSSQTTMSISPSSLAVKVNQTFNIEINVSGVSDLYGWEFKLGYNTTLLELVSAAEGSFLNSSRDTYFVPKNVSADGYVLAGCTSLRNVTGLSGNGTLATVEFRAKALGSCALDLYDTKLVNSAKQLMGHSEVDGTATARGYAFIKVQYIDGYPRSGADVAYIWPEPADFIGTTDEQGLVSCESLPYPEDYLVQACYKSIQFGQTEGLYIDENGNGHTTITANYEITPPIITILSPQNLTYSNSSVPLTFTVYDYSPISWIGYSLDNQSNTTITGNTIISVGNGAHEIVVYANDTFGNMGVSNEVLFERAIIVPDDYPSIQDAINAASTGDTVYVRNGTYYENVAVNKTVSLVGQNAQSTIIDGGGVGSVLTITTDYVNVTGFTMRNSSVGLPNAGISLDGANYCNITENNITAHNMYGITLKFSQYNSVSGNTIANNGYGILLTSSSNNSIFHNKFVNNNIQVYSSDSANVWDDGYSSGGNFWSDYNGTDWCHGPSQNVFGSDGIGDTPYVIDAQNQDNYPFVAPECSITMGSSAGGGKYSIA